MNYTHLLSLADECKKYFIKEQCDVSNRNKRSKLKLNNLRVCFVRVENEIVNEQVDVSCNSSLFICFMKESVLRIVVWRKLVV